MEKFNPIGKKVRVYFSRADAIFEGVVLYSPCATGDCWQIETDDTIEFVMNFEKMVFEKENPNDE